MELFLLILIVAFALGYVVELLVSITQNFISPKILKTLLTYPLSLLATWLLGVSGPKLFIYSAASAFVYLVLMLVSSRPKEEVKVLRR